MASDNDLTFDTHVLNVQVYSASDLHLEYAGTSHDLSWGELAREKTPQDESRYPNGKSGSYRTFAGPVRIEWRSRDGSRHSHLLNLDDVFKDRKVLHTEKPERIYQPMPITGGEPTIIIEINDRSVNVYLFAAIQLISDDPGSLVRDQRDHFTLAYSKTF